MTDITPAQLDELEALEKAATAGPWTAGDKSVQYTGKPIPATWYTGAHVASTYDQRDAELIAAIRNAAPSLFASLRAAWARIEELERGDLAGETCAGCTEPATKRDVDRVPLCADCYQDCLDAKEHAE